MNMNKVKMLLVAAVAIAATSCTDAEKAVWSAYGDEARITCYSGGQIVFDDISTGIVQDSTQGLVFKSKTTGKAVQTFADCVITL